MPDKFTRTDLESLLNAGSPHCLSLYMPTEKTEPGVRQNLIRFKNLLTEAEELLSQRGTPSGPAAKILRPLQKMISDNFYWANQDAGLAILGSSETVRMWRLSMECDKLAVVADHFHLKPMMTFLQTDHAFYVLALSRNDARLLHCSNQGAVEVKPAGMPRGLAEALKYDDPQKQLQFHTGAKGASGRRPAMFHGHGAGIDESKENLLRYFQAVNKSLESMLRKETAPLIIACVGYLFPVYRTANTYPHLLEEIIEGNPDGLRAEQLQACAWPIVEKLVEGEKDYYLSVFEKKAGTGYSSTNIEEIAQAARYGRVDILFVAEDEEQWGVFDETGRRAVLHDGRRPDNYDLSNYAAVQTLNHGGTVFTNPAARVPGGRAAAIYRY